MMKSFLLRYTSLFMALYLLNCSVDAPDATHFGTKENLKYNEQESIVELVVEKALGYENAIAEYDDTDEENEASAKKNFAIDYFILPTDIQVAVKVNLQQNEEHLSKEKSFISHFTGAVSPPPEV